eukprot:scaffold2420_cov259-Pinguiococcus_pyrenoidosus.AAC.6
MVPRRDLVLPLKELDKNMLLSGRGELHPDLEVGGYGGVLRDRDLHPPALDLKADAQGHHVQHEQASQLLRRHTAANRCPDRAALRYDRLWVDRQTELGVFLLPRGRIDRPQPR